MEACEIISSDLRENALNLELIPSRLLILSYVKTKQNLPLNSSIIEKTSNISISGIKKNLRKNI